MITIVVMAALREVGSISPTLEAGKQAQKSEDIVCGFEYLGLL